MSYIRAFIAGMIVPCFFLPIGLTIAVNIGASQMLQMLFIHLLPLIWGAWNVLYFAIGRNHLAYGLNYRLLGAGALLGFLVASYGVFVLDLPQLLGVAWYVPLLLAPVIYALVWRFIVHPLNQLLSLED